MRGRAGGGGEGRGCGRRVYINNIQTERGIRRFYKAHLDGERGRG